MTRLVTFRVFWRRFLVFAFIRFFYFFDHRGMPMMCLKAFANRLMTLANNHKGVIVYARDDVFNELPPKLR